MKSEHLEQVELISWWRKNRSERIFAIPNGGSRHIREAAKFKAEGVSSGVPDLFCPELLLWVEMKREKGGRLSSTQKDWIEYLESIGQTVIVGHGFEDAKEKIIKLFL